MPQENKPWSQLNAQALVYEQFDWWSLEELATHLLMLPDSTAGMCVAPLDADGTGTEAWVRWAAVDDNVPPGRALAALLNQHAERLHALGTRSIWAVCQRGSWLARHLRDNGFSKVDEIITLELRKSNSQISPMGGEGLRAAMPADLVAIDMLDTQAFVAQWRYPMSVLARVLSRCHTFQVVESAGAVIGYVCASYQAGAAHIIRLAVQPAFRNKGIGSMLLADALVNLFAAGANRVTINTPRSFTAIDLYRKLGFRQLIEMADVYRREI